MFNFIPQTANEGALLVSDDVIYRIVTASDLSKPEMPISFGGLVYNDSIDTLTVRASFSTLYGDKPLTLDIAPWTKS